MTLPPANSNAGDATRRRRADESDSPSSATTIANSATAVNDESVEFFEGPILTKMQGDDFTAFDRAACARGIKRFLRPATDDEILQALTVAGQRGVTHTIVTELSPGIRVRAFVRLLSTFSGGSQN